MPVEQYFLSKEEVFFTVTETEGLGGFAEARPVEDVETNLHHILEEGFRPLPESAQEYIIPENNSGEHDALIALIPLSLVALHDLTETQEARVVSQSQAQV